MGEPMAVSIAGTVASKLLEQVMEATKIATGFRKYCKVLHALLKELQPVVDHAVRQISESNFDNAFKSPRSAVHDWLDELEGTLKRAAVEVNKCIKQQPDLNPVSRYNTGKRILDVTESVNKLSQQAGLVGLAVTWTRELIVNEDAHKLPGIQQVPQPVFGLDNFTMRLQQSVTSSSIDAEPRCVGVWGMGGAGKTLLAQIAYHSREVREHFKGGKLIWLTVSQTPNIKGLYDSFCRQLGLPPMSFAQLEEYGTRLYNEFLRRRVFLVLDDVWNKGVLEQLDLAKGRGSVTLVTTRNQPVLKKAGVIDEDEVQVGVLSKEDSWKLFCVHAFPSGFSNIPSQLHEVAELIAEECKGLPLALKVIGGSMVGKTTLQEWEFQVNCLRESRELPEQQEEKALFGRLKLSYDNLDNDNPVCKECFLGFGAFPEDRMVKMEELIKLWKAQGLLDDGTKMFGDDPTQSAYYLVGLLIGRSLIEVAQYDLTYACKVHDVMRDLALHIIKGQRPITCLYRPGKELVEFPEDWIRTYERQPCEVRKLSLMENDLTTLNGVTFSAPKLEVLLLAGNGKLEAVPKQFLKGIENLKVLDLSNCTRLKSLPREIGNLRQLTHLDLSVSKLESLPKEIGKLTQLTHLNLQWCKLESLPKEIGKLTQLTHLNLCSCGQLKSLPKEIGKLTQLTHLDLGSCENLKSLPKEVWKLTQLIYLELSYCRILNYCPSTIGDLRSLQYLGLYQDDPSKKLHSEAFAAYICRLTTLTELHISGNTCETLELCEQLSKLVSKLVKLKRFYIWSFDKLETFPDSIQSMVDLEELHVVECKWIKILPSVITLFSKLKVLTLRSLPSLASVPALNILKMLSTLSINNCGSIKKLPESFTSADAFPSLKTLEFYNSGLLEFSQVEDGAMPKLQILDLNCPNINNLPETLIYLKNLKEVYIPEVKFYDLCEKFENTWLLGKFISSKYYYEVT